jgi:peptidoglycan/LPS O-acetylase OafA/YrhL
LGEISYGIYIYQLPVYKLSSYLFVNILKFNQPIFQFYLNFVILVIFSFLSYKFIESPIVKYTKAFASNSFINK